MIEKIVNNNTLYAIIIRRDFSFDGIKFFTEDSSPQQIGYMKRPKNYKIAPHIHLKKQRIVDVTHEVLFIKSGKVKINFYNHDQQYIMSKELSTGDTILLAEGGHGLTMIEESEIIEVKQGPYLENLDKERFDSDE
tara:strand:- start:40912 stop:41319 length:408 start_codon:yes stop_codon:yes gene_type:complete